MRRSMVKTNTTQFHSRLSRMAAWIESVGFCMIPDLQKLFAKEENTMNGPDR